MKIAVFIATGLHSYSIIEEPGFIVPIECAAPDFIVPCQTFC